MATSSHLQPRRREPRQAQQASSVLGITPCSDNNASLRKGATFHSPTLPSSPTDPTLHVRALPARAISSPRELQNLLDLSQQHVEDIANAIRTLDLDKDSSTYALAKEVLPLPMIFLAHTVCNRDFLKTGIRDVTQANHQHASDSGLGSSLTTSIYKEPHSYVQAGESMIQTGLHNTSTLTNSTEDLSSTSVHTPSRIYSAATKSFSSPRSDKSLDEYAVVQIKKHLVEPLLKENSIKEYHTLVEDLPHRITSKKIICLRDIEKTLIFLAEVSTDFSHGEVTLAYQFFHLVKFRAKSSASYLHFCQLVVQCLHTTVEHLNEIDQRRPTDQPYTNTYFVDLVQQVSQYARIMAVTRQKQARGQALDDTDLKAFVNLEPHLQYAIDLLATIRGEKLKLRQQDGKPAELVRERADGTCLPLEGGFTMIDENILEADMERSMARKRKCDIGKIECHTCRECSQTFTRACDLTKHEKTHSRPWKCPESDCKYHSDGWPTEKERDRHFNDKHLKNAAQFKCLFQPCAYSSKRESNCKQHMEKAHGWEYVRARTKKGQKLVSSTSHTNLPSTLPTPESDSLTSPTSTAMLNSPDLVTNASFSPDSELENSEFPELYDYSLAMGASLSPEFEQPLADSHLTIHQDPTFDTTMSYSGHLTSPDCPDLMNSPGTGYNYSPTNPTMPPLDEFEFTFDLDATNSGWKRLQSTFPQWFPTNVTPYEASDANMTKPLASEQQMIHPGYGNSFQNNSTMNNYGAFATSGAQELYDQDQSMGNYIPVRHSSSAQLDFTLFTQEIMPVSSAQADFTLFTEETRCIGTQASASGPLFPEHDLGAVGGQFYDMHEESIYDEPMETEDNMMERYMNFDEETDAA